MWLVFSLQLAKFQTWVGKNTGAGEKGVKHCYCTPILGGGDDGHLPRSAPAAPILPPHHCRSAGGSRSHLTFTSLSQPQETMMGLLLFGEKRTHDTHSE